MAMTVLSNSKFPQIQALTTAKADLLLGIRATCIWPSLSLTGGIYLASLHFETLVINGKKNPQTNPKSCETLHNLRWQVKQ